MTDIPDRTHETVEARFWVAECHAHPSPGGKVIFRAVSRGDQNRKWSSATPAGQLEMTVTNDAAFQTFADWMKSKLDIRVLLSPVPVLSPSDGHPFRPAEQEPGQAWPPSSLCGDCGQPHPSE